MDKRKIIIVSAIVLTVVFVVSSIICVHELHEYNVAQKEYAEILVHNTTSIAKPAQTYSGSGSSEAINIITDPDAPDFDLPDLVINFRDLVQTNSDCIGWIYIPSLDVSYPVVQSADNIEYITTTFNGTENMAGCIFSDCRITAPFVQKTILYGHNMKNGSMFHKLFEIEKNPEDNSDIWIYLTNVSIYHYSVDKVERVSMTDKNVYSVSSTYSDELILSTCIKNETRLVVVAKRDWVYV